MAGDRRDSEFAPEARGNGSGVPTDTSAKDRLLFGGRRENEQRIPIVEEQVTVGKREVETGRVRVHTIVDEEKLDLHELLERDVVDIERVPVGREVAQAPLPFEEGDTLIIPVIEERLVVEKRLVVVEEIRVRRRQERTETEIPVTRRVMRAEVERTAPPPAQPGPPPPTPEPRGRTPSPAASYFGEPTSANLGSLPTESPGTSPARSTSSFSSTPAARKETNWPLIVLGIALVLLLLLVLASRS